MGDLSWDCEGSGLCCTSQAQVFHVSSMSVLRVGFTIGALIIIPIQRGIV